MASKTSAEPCPLCKSVDTEEFFYQSKLNRLFLTCSSCDLKFVPRAQLLTVVEERKRYELHDNSIRTKGYEAFLLRLVNPILERYPDDAKGLDFGEGPYPMLREILSEKGYKNILGYDPIFNMQKSVFDFEFDFITCCEVLEHVSNPFDILFQLIKLLKKESSLIVSTGVINSEIDFPSWHYITDVTHINIFSENTLRWISNRYNLEIEFPDKDLVIFWKK